MRLFLIQNFPTKLITLFIICAFLDEALTVSMGEVYFTPLKFLSLFIFVYYLLYIQKYSLIFRGRNLSHRLFIVLYTIIIVYCLFDVLSTTTIGVALERSFHFISSLMLASLFYTFLIREQINLSYLLRVLFFIFFIELLVGSIEMLLQRPIINMGIVPDSPLTIKAFHADRVFLAEYLFIGLMLLSFFKVKKITSLVLISITILVSASSGSNTSLLLVGIFFLYLLKGIKSKFTKIAFVVIGIMMLSSITYIRTQMLSSEDLSKIQKRDEMYYASDDKASNWRVFSMKENTLNLVNSPSVFGHGYEKNQYFLQKLTGYHAPMKAHNFTALFYDYGFLGCVIVLLVLFYLFKFLYKSFRFLGDVKILVGFLFAILIVSRLFFYFHTTLVWIYIIGFPLVSYSTVCLNRKK